MVDEEEESKPEPDPLANPQGVGTPDVEMSGGGSVRRRMNPSSTRDTT